MTSALFEYSILLARRYHSLKVSMKSNGIQELDDGDDSLRLKAQVTNSEIKLI